MDGLQVFVDLALLLSVLSLIYLFTRERDIKTHGIDAKTFSEFKTLIEDSRSSSDRLYETLSELKGIAAVLDKKEKRLMALAGQGETSLNSTGPGTSSREKRYIEVARLAGQGLAEKDIAEKLNLTQGEIGLILALHQEKNEYSTNRTSFT